MFADTVNDIRAIALDVDGVLTDGGFWWGADGAPTHLSSGRGGSVYNVGSDQPITIGALTGRVAALTAPGQGFCVWRRGDLPNFASMYSVHKSTTAAFRKALRPA